MRRRPLLHTVVALTIAAGCTAERAAHDPLTTTTAAPASTTTVPATSTSTTATTTSTTVALPPPVPIQWSACGGGFQCATLAVPVDYARPRGATLELALIRRPAGDPARRIGTLLMNPGGPGASGVRRVRRGFTISAEVAARFDIVGFDPRGIGGSTPITCGAAVPAFRATDLDPDTPTEEAALAAAARAVADECTLTEGDRIGHLGTAEVVHDIEVIRRSLGEAQLSFVGLSYGTLLGLLWADAYPQSVRAMVLDGVVSPGSSGEAAAASQIEAIDDVLHDIDDGCAAAPSCPAAPHGGALAAYDELARRLEAGTASGQGVGPTQLAYAAFSATYGSERWAQLWQALADGLAGDLRGIAEMAGWFTRLVDYTPYAIVSCLDSEHPAGYHAWQEAAAESARRSPRLGRIAANEMLPCAFWPRATLRPHPVQATGSAPILVVGSTGDAATPYEQAVAVAKELDAGVLLTVEIDGHIAIDASPCADAAITRYLVDGTTPAPGTRC